LAFDGLGQRLFAPPNVKGWDGGKAWINSVTLVARHNLAWAVLTGAAPRPARADHREGAAAPPIRTDLISLPRRHAGEEPERQVDFLLGLFLQGDCHPPARRKLITYLGDDDKQTDRAGRLRETAHAVLTMPEYQLA